MSKTTKVLVAKAAADVGDDLDTLECVYLPMENEERSWEQQVRQREIVRCRFKDLPERAFSAGYGGVEGEPVICFSDKYVYVKVVYDGSEWVEAVPRHPHVVTAQNLPELGQ